MEVIQCPNEDSLDRLRTWIAQNGCRHPAEKIEKYFIRDVCTYRHGRPGFIAFVCGCECHKEGYQI